MQILLCFSIIRILYHAFCIQYPHMQYNLCPLQYIVCPVSYFLSLVYYFLCTIKYILQSCVLFNILRNLFNISCVVFNISCVLFNISCVLYSVSIQKPECTMYHIFTKKDKITIICIVSWINLRLYPSTPPPSTS